MIYLVKFSTIAFLIINLSFSCRADNGIDSIIHRYRVFLLRTEKSDENTSKWIKTLHHGKWPDVDYQNQERGEWKTRQHLVRLRDLAIAWINPNSPFFHSPALQQTIQNALDHWLEQKYNNPNWWHNEIGTPQLMRDIIILMKAQLSARQITKALSVLHQFRINGTGANLTWSADLALHYGALTGDIRMMDSCRSLLISEVKIGKQEGIQPDFSYHQHGARLQNFHYGKSFLLDNTRLAWQLRNTAWAFPEDKIILLARLLNDGDRWMSRGVFIAPCTVDRAISRPGFLAEGNLSVVIQMLKDLVPQMTGRLNSFQVSYTHPGWKGYKNFPYSDFSSYNDSNFSFYLKTISKRTLTSETHTNSENIKGGLLNGGNTYYIRNGNEYTDLMPVWNWNNLPGMTNFTDTTAIEPKQFNGGVGNEYSGINAMDYAITAGSKKVRAHKIWVVHKGIVVCLLAGLTTEGSSDSVFTTLDQCRLQTDVISNGVKKHTFYGTKSCPSVKWTYHNQFAYLPLYKSEIRLFTGNVKGAWYRINNGQSKQIITEKIFMPVMYHGKNLQDDRAGYVVAACTSSKYAQALYKKPTWSIIKNDSKSQVVQFNDGLIAAAFFKEGTIKLNNGGEVTAEYPCVIMFDGKTLTVGDPSHTKGSFRVNVNRKWYWIRSVGTGEPTTIKI